MGFCFVIISTNGMTQLFCTHMRCVCMYVIIIHLWAWTKVKNYSVPPPLPFLVCLLCFCFIAFSLFSLCSLLLVLSSPCALFHLLYQLLSVYKGISTYDYIVEQRNEAPRESRCNTTELCSCSKVNLTLHVLMSLLNCIIIHMHVCT